MNVSFLFMVPLQNKTFFFAAIETLSPQMIDIWKISMVIIIKDKQNQTSVKAVKTVWFCSYKQQGKI